MNEDQQNLSAVDDFKRWLVNQRKEALGVYKTQPDMNQHRPHPA